MGRPSNGMDMREAALNCVASGWSIFPCRDKRPLIASGFKNASRSHIQIDAWWTQWPEAQIGAAVPSTLMVVDVDGEDGRASLQALQAVHVPLPLTRTCHTGGGGIHYWFRNSEALRQTAGLLGKGIDTRMPEKGYVILPPSLHASGKRYEWVNDTQKAVPLPGWMARRLRKPPPPYRPPLTATYGTTKYAQAALDGETATVASAIVGQRNTDLHTAAVKLGTLVGAGVVNEGAVWTALTDAAHVNGLVADSGLNAALKTIRSGLTWGIAHPREVSL